MHKHLDRHGFTLIEVVLAIAVGLIIIAGVSVGYNYVKKAAITEDQRNNVGLSTPTSTPIVAPTSTTSAPTSTPKKVPVVVVDSCNTISTWTFRSVSQHETGPTPTGVSMGYWQITFSNGNFDWQHSDTPTVGTYTCKNNVLQVTSNYNRAITAGYDNSRQILIWNGIEYKKDKGTIYGTVRLREGNCMPGVYPGSGAPSSCRTIITASKVYIYPLLAPSQVTEVNGSWTPLNPQLLIKQVVTNQQGYYEVQMPPGTYSVFAEDNGQKYCNFMHIVDPKGACPVVVADKGISYDITIDHAAY